MCFKWRDCLVRYCFQGGFQLQLLRCLLLLPWRHCLIWQIAKAHLKTPSGLCFFFLHRASCGTQISSLLNSCLNFSNNLHLLLQELIFIFNFTWIHFINRERHPRPLHNVSFVTVWHHYTGCYVSHNASRKVVYTCWLHKRYAFHSTHKTKRSVCKSVDKLPTQSPTANSLCYILIPHSPPHNSANLCANIVKFSVYISYYIYI